MRVLITGAGGYIGRHLTTECLNKGYEVIAVDLNVPAVDSRAERITLDILSGRNNLYTELGSPDICIHLAWRDGFFHDSQRHMDELPLHISFLKQMIDNGVQRIAVMGSMHEVGYFEGMLDENTQCNPISQYGIAKNALRETIKEYARKTETVFYWIRAFYIVGDDIHNHSVFTKIINAAQNGQSTFPFTTGKNQYDFLDVQELAMQITSIVSQTDVTGVIHCCSGQPVSLGEKVEQFIAENHLDISLEYGAYRERSYDSPGVWGDASKINRIMDSIRKNWNSSEQGKTNG